MQPLSRIEGWLRERFCHHPSIHFGLSGATLLCEALRIQDRSAVVLSAFICPSISAMAARAGKRLVHVDADPLSLHPDRGRLEMCLAQQDASDTVLLIDHSFGYPFPGLADLKRRFPNLLIIEDCVRALGAKIDGRLVGEYSDWVLLSMYKTIRGSQNGAVLLTKTPLGLSTAGRAPASLRERAATLPPLRFVYDLLKRCRPEFEPRSADCPAPHWTPAYGLPGDLCLERFGSELRDFEDRSALRHAIAGEFTDNLQQIPGVDCIQVAPGCQPSGHFVSFRLPSRAARDSILTRLHKRGLFLSRTWDLLPAHYTYFSETFPCGQAGSQYLADKLAHIPVNLFLNTRHRRRLVRALRELCSEYVGAAAVM